MIGYVLYHVWYASEMHFVLQHSSHHGAFSASSASRMQSLHATPQKCPNTTAKVHSMDHYVCVQSMSGNQ